MNSGERRPRTIGGEVVEVQEEVCGADSSGTLVALPELQVSVVNVPAVPAKGRGVRGRTSRRSAGRRGGVGSSGMDALDELRILNIEDLPSGTRHETPLHVKRRRLWNPESDHAPALTSALGPSSHSPGPSSALLPAGPSPAVAPSPAPSSIDAFAPSPATFIECDDKTAVTTPRRSPELHHRMPPTRRPLSEDKILYYGSEESGSDGEDDGLVPMLIPRVYRVALDTPLDPEHVQQIASAGWPAVSAETPAATSEPTDPRDGAMLPVDPFEFVWSNYPDPPIPSRKRREPFSQAQVGPTVLCENGYEIFTTIWDHKILEHIVNETNRYAQERALRKMEEGELGPYSRLTRWVDTSIDEMYTFMAIILAMGVVLKTKLDEYWCNTQDIFVTPGFRAHMTLKRFELLNSCLHFNNNSVLRVSELTHAEAKLHKIEPIITHLNSKFQSMYALSQNVALDESLLQWKGWLSINQFIANKAAKVGIKTYEVCESQSGYLWRFEVHAHRRHVTQEQQSPLDGFIPSIVLRLVQGLEGKGHTIWMDNFFNSPALARRLKSTGFDVVGTLRTNRQFVPRSIAELTKANMRPGQITGITSGDVDLMVWRDENRVATISTYHGNEVQSVDGKLKPCLVHDYNVMMGGVDKKDQMLAMYPIERKRTCIWYKKFFRRLLNVSVLNSYIIAKKSRLKTIDHRSFRIELITSILKRHCQATSLKPLCDENFLARTHYILEQPLGTNKSRLRRKCVSCGKLTHYYCAGCVKSVCIGPCFVAMH